jgi:hypothetical protein
LVVDPTVPEEPRGSEPAALVAQAADAVGRVAQAGLLPGGGRVAEYGSPHGGSWLDLLTGRGLTVANDGEQADVVVDCFGLMHAANQSAALEERATRVASGGVLLVQYHSLGTIVRTGQWNVLRHGHYAYYSTAAIAEMLTANGFSARRVWHFDLYGGTLLLAAARQLDPTVAPDGSVEETLAEEDRAGVLDPGVVAGLQRHVERHGRALESWLRWQRASGTTVVGYGAASRAVALLVRAGVDRSLLGAVVDNSPTKQGLRMPGTDIPIVGPAELQRHRPGAVLLFVPDLLPEVRAAFPEVEASGAVWVNVDELASWQSPVPDVPLAPE